MKRILRNTNLSTILLNRIFTLSRLSYPFLTLMVNLYRLIILSLTLV